MRFTWNPEKRLANLKKHGLDFADAERVFSGHTLTYPDHRFGYAEERFITVGLLDGVAVIIGHTETDTETHLISMRKAERHEREKYFGSTY
ncbi:MAG: BrnT family toxin [Methylobacillus sp.]|nr:BrnT family toxin [Methylobacillus sp.]